MTEVIENQIEILQRKNWLPDTTVASLSQRYQLKYHPLTEQFLVTNLNSGERLLERMADGVYHADLAACNEFTDQPVVEDVAALVIAGDADRMTPLRAAQAVARMLPRARTVVLEDCGHSMLAERPNEVLDALAAFVMTR